MIIFIAIKVRSPAKVFFVFSLPQNIVLSRKSFILNLHYNNNRLLGANAFISWNLCSAWTLSTFGCDGGWRKRTTFPRLAQAAELVHHPSSTFIICKTETNEASAPISEHERQSSIMPLWAKYHGAMGVLVEELPLLFSAAVLSFSWSWNVRIVLLFLLLLLSRRAAETGVRIYDSSETTWHRSRRSSRRASERLIDQTDRPMTQLKAKPTSTLPLARRLSSTHYWIPLSRSSSHFYYSQAIWFQLCFPLPWTTNSSSRTNPSPISTVLFRHTVFTWT